MWGEEAVRNLVLYAKMTDPKHPEPSDALSWFQRLFLKWSGQYESYNRALRYAQELEYESRELQREQEDAQAKKEILTSRLDSSQRRVADLEALCAQRDEQMAAINGRLESVTHDLEGAVSARNAAESDRTALIHASGENAQALNALVDASVATFHRLPIAPSPRYVFLRWENDSLLLSGVSPAVAQHYNADVARSWQNFFGHDFEAEYARDMLSKGRSEVLSHAARRPRHWRAGWETDVRLRAGGFVRRHCEADVIALPYAAAPLVVTRLTLFKSIDYIPSANELSSVNYLVFDPKNSEALSMIMQYLTNSLVQRKLKDAYDMRGMASNPVSITVGNPLLPYVIDLKYAACLPSSRETLTGLSALQKLARKKKFLYLLNVPVGVASEYDLRSDKMPGRSTYHVDEDSHPPDPSPL